MAAPALLSHEMADTEDTGEFGPLENILTSDVTAYLLTLMASGEALADKTDFVPDRTSAVPLIGRAVIGSVVAAAFAIQRKQSAALPALIGAAAAVASTFGAFHARKFAREHYDVPDALLGLLEDGIILAASKAVVDTIEEEFY